MHLTRINSAMVLILALGFAIPAARADNFTDVSKWATYDAGANGVGTDPRGYPDAVFDGQYIYFAPLNRPEAHCEVLRYDANQEFAAAGSWATFDPAANGVGDDPKGFAGAVFDGRYVYFTPYRYPTPPPEMLRYDTEADFFNASSWVAFDPGANGVGTNDGYPAAVSAGQYIYFVPYYNGSAFHGEVLRYDKTGVFDDPSSWSAYNPGANGVGTDPRGYYGAAFDGRYVYFSPLERGTSPFSELHGEVLRYDTQGVFDSASSWVTYDPGDNGVGTDPDGYGDAIFDGHYVYFAPFYNGSDWNGEVLRYNANGAFDNPTSWATYDATANGVGTNTRGNWHGVFDGRYVYFSPYRNPEEHGEALRYDTRRSFTAASSWSAFDAGANGVGTDPDGYQGAVYDGRYVYFAPHYNGTEQHGEVLRFDTLLEAIPAVSEWGLVAMSLLVLTAGTLIYTRRCASRVAD